MTVFIIALTTLAVFAGDAQAAAPTLLSVSQQDRHPTATFSAAEATYATIQIATSPDRDTAGHFLQENHETTGILTAAEIANGYWKYYSQLDPGV